MKMLDLIRAKIDAYAAKGNKGNRRQQIARMEAFIEHAYGLGARHLGQVGAVHVIRYWKTHRALSDATLYNHWLALCQLWKMSGKAVKPPEPRYRNRSKEDEKMAEK